MGAHYEQTVAELKQLAAQHESVAVAFSGGKDSLVTLDLAMRFFKKIYPYYMYFVPGLLVDQQRLAILEDRFGLKVLLYPHYTAIEGFRTSTYVDPFEDFDDFPKMDNAVIHRAVMADTGATLVLNGQKKADGFFRRRLIANSKRTMDYVCRPLKDWVRWEVLAYCKAHDLPIHSAAGKDNSGICLANHEILHLYDNEPLDYETLRSYFPYIEAVVVRRELYGLSDD